MEVCQTREEREMEGEKLVLCQMLVDIMLLLSVATFLT